MAPLARITSGPSGYGVLLVAYRTFHLFTTIIRFHVIEICFDGRVQKYSQMKKIFWCRDFVIFPSSCNALLLITHNALLLLSIAWLLLYTHNAFVICTWSRIIILKKTSYTTRKVTKNKNSIFSCFIIYL